MLHNLIARTFKTLIEPLRNHFTTYLQIKKYTMSYKPSRDSGIMFGNAKLKSAKYYNEASVLIQIYNPPPFNKINYLSKLFYLYSLNESKAYKTDGEKTKAKMTEKNRHSGKIALQEDFHKNR